jgi:hypothetical protein
VIHEKLEDGTEITWNLKQTTFSKAKKSIQPKVKLLCEVTKEFSHVGKS